MLCDGDSGGGMDTELGSPFPELDDTLIGDTPDGDFWLSALGGELSSSELSGFAMNSPGKTPRRRAP